MVPIWAAALLLALACIRLPAYADEPAPVVPPPQDQAAPPPQPAAPPEQAAPEQSAPPQPSQEKPPEPPPPETPAPAKTAPQPPKNLEPLFHGDTVTVLGKKVRGPAGEDMGRVVDLLLDRDAQIQAVVIDFGGFLGVGSRKIAIDWRLVQFRPDEREAPLALSLGKAEVQAAPEYKDTAQPPVMVGQPPPPPEPPDSDATR